MTEDFVSDYEQVTGNKIPVQILPVVAPAKKSVAPSTEGS